MFVAENVEDLAQKTEETERKQMEWLNQEWNDIEWVGLAIPVLFPSQDHLQREES